MATLIIREEDIIAQEFRTGFRTISETPGVYEDALSEAYAHHIESGWHEVRYDSGETYRQYIVANDAGERRDIFLSLI